MAGMESDSSSEEYIEAAEDSSTHRLLGFPTSPFVRKVLVMVQEKGIRHLINSETCLNTPLAPSAELCSLNPLGKIPCLITSDSMALYDSPVICEYLDSLDSTIVCFPPSGTARWIALRRQALGDGVMDATVLVRYESHMRPEEAGSWPEMVAAQTGKVERALDSLEGEACHLDPQLVDIGTIAMACALGYLDLRLSALDWRAGRPLLSSWYASFADRQSMQDTWVDPSVDPLKISGSGAFASK